jgi:hypothetical protein
MHALCQQGRTAYRRRSHERPLGVSSEPCALNTSLVISPVRCRQIRGRHVNATQYGPSELWCRRRYCLLGGGQPRSLFALSFNILCDVGHKIFFAGLFLGLAAIQSNERVRLVRMALNNRAAAHGVVCPSCLWLRWRGALTWLQTMKASLFGPSEQRSGQRCMCVRHHRQPLPNTPASKCQPRLEKQVALIETPDFAVVESSQYLALILFPSS